MYMCVQDKSSTKTVDHVEGGGKGDKKSGSKQKGKKDSSTATEKRRDQPLLLEFESLFESLQVCTCILCMVPFDATSSQVGTRIQKSCH